MTQATVSALAPTLPPVGQQMVCGMCGGRLARAYLTPGSWVEDRCHHSVIRGGKRQTCGYVTRVAPTR